MLVAVLIGTGGSEGVPVPGCVCPACNEARIYHFAKRRTASVFITSYGTSIMVDMSLDASEYVEEMYLDAVLITHWHHDHIAGLYKFRWIEKPVDLYAPSGDVDPEIRHFPKSLRIRYVKPFEKIDLGDMEVTPLPLNHTIETFGYLVEVGRKENIAILYDTKLLPKETEELLKKKEIKVALIDATTAPGSHDPKHNNVDEAVEIGKRIGAEEIILTHISHRNLPFSRLVKYVRERWDNVYVSYDGMMVYVV